MCTDGRTDGQTDRVESVCWILAEGFSLIIMVYEGVRTATMNGFVRLNVRPSVYKNYELDLTFFRTFFFYSLIAHVSKGLGT